MAKNNGTNCSKLESNGKLLIKPAKVNFGYENSYIFFNVLFLFDRSDQHANTNSLVQFFMH